MSFTRSEACCWYSPALQVLNFQSSRAVKAQNGHEAQFDDVLNCVYIARDSNISNGRAIVHSLGIQRPGSPERKKATRLLDLAEYDNSVDTKCHQHIEAEFTAEKHLRCCIWKL